MKAIEMFKKLGYEQTLDKEHMMYNEPCIKYIGEGFVEIDFYLIHKTFSKDAIGDVTDITMPELHAINAQCKELGWL